MKTLIIYEKDTGNVISTRCGGTGLIGGVDCLTKEIPENKIVKSVNVYTNELVLEDMKNKEESEDEDNFNEIEYEDTVEELQDSVIDLKYENLILKTGEK